MKNKPRKRVANASQKDFGYFFVNCSVRGVSKAYKSSSLVIKSVWLIFIILMLILLSYSIIKIVKEYLEYNTTIQTMIEIESASLFPAITVCPYQPFSNRAVEYFEKGGMSPKEFSQKLRRSAAKHLERNEPQIAESIIFYDDLRIYYQNLPYKDSINIGLNQSEIFVFCITKLRIGMFFGKADSNCAYDISRYSTPDFFNCYTVNVKPKYTKSTEYIHIILRFPKPESLNKYRETSLLKSLSQNIIGAQLLVHESQSSPLSKTEKIHIEPNRLLQINYQNNQWQDYSTTMDYCEYDESQTIIDLENTYKFSFPECLASYNAKDILAKCGCVMAFLPRSIIPSHEFPYCGSFGNLTEEGFTKFRKQLRCIHKALESLEKMTSSEKNCYKRCEIQRFNFHISSINWKPNLWQLEWLFKLQESWNTLIDGPKNFSNTEKAKNVAMQFLHANNLNDLKSSDGNEIFQMDEQYACVVLERFSNETFFKKEKLGISLYGLVSRIGGSCTLYLGLNCALFIEIIESVIILWKDRPSHEAKCDKGDFQENPLNHSEIGYVKGSPLISDCESNFNNGQNAS